MAEQIQNAWKNVCFQPEKKEEPEHLQEVVSIVNEARAAGKKVKVIGGGHSMNHIFRTDHILIDLKRLNRILSIDRASGVVEVEAGLTLGDAIEECNKHGLHFPSLGSWYTQSIAGAIATSTHGSSLKYGSLSDIVLEVEVVLADGSVKEYSGNSDEAMALRCHLGQLGILTKVKLQLSPAFWLRCKITAEPESQAFANILQAARNNDYVNMLWIPDAEKACTRVLATVPAGAPCSRNKAAIDEESLFVDKSTFRHRIEDVWFFLCGHVYLWSWLPKFMRARISDYYCRKIEGAFCDDEDVIDKSYRVFLYDQYREPTENHRLRMIMNVEYAFDIDQLEPLLKRLSSELKHLRDEGSYLNYPRVHVRFAKMSKDTLIGLNADRDTAYVGIYVVGSINHKSQIPIAKTVENIFVKYGGRPHWGKYSYLWREKSFFAQTSIHSIYKGYQAFQKVRRQLDPIEMFSSGTDMFQNSELFARAPLGAMMRSIFDPDEYQPIRLLK